MLAIKNEFCESKPQTNQNADFGKPDFAIKRQRQRNRDNFTNSTYPKLCEKKTRRFREPTQPTMNKTEATKQSQSKPTLTKTQIENLEANFPAGGCASDSTK